MKLKTLAIIAGVMFTLVLGHEFGFGQMKQKLEDITVCVGTTTAVMVGGYEPSRKYYAVGNWSAEYIVFHATFPITQAHVQRSTWAVLGQEIQCGIPLAPYQNGSDLNTWIDQYNIYPSSWYVLVSSKNAEGSAVKVMVTYRQRK